MRKHFVSIAVAFALVSLVPGAALADLTRGDANDVGFRLDVQRSASVSTADRLGLGVFYYDRIAKRRQPRVRVLYDSFGGPRPDFVLRFHYLRYSPHDFRLACDFVRLADRRLSMPRLPTTSRPICTATSLVRDGW